MQNESHKRGPLGWPKKAKWESAYLANYVVATIAWNAMVKISVHRLHFNFTSFICFSSAFALFGVCFIYGKLLGRTISWSTLRGFSGSLLPALTIYAMLSTHITMMQDDARFAQAVRIITCFSPATALLHRRIMSTCRSKSYEIVTALLIAFAAVLANIHLRESLEPLHYAFGFFWLLLLYMLFAWYEHLKKAVTIDGTYELLTTSMALFTFSLIPFVIDSHLLDVFHYIEMNEQHTFPYIVLPAVSLSTAWYVGSLVQCLTAVPIFTISLATASVPAIQLWISFVAPMQYVLLDAWPNKVSVLAQFILLLSVAYYFERRSFDKLEKYRMRSILNH